MVNEDIDKTCGMCNNNNIMDHGDGHSNNTYNNNVRPRRLMHTTRGLEKCELQK